MTDSMPNPLLAIVGSLMLVVAAVGLFVAASPTLSGSFLFLGTASLVVSVFEPRMEGPQRIGPTRLDLTLGKLERKAKKSARAADRQLQGGTVTPVDEAVVR